MADVVTVRLPGALWEAPAGALTLTVPRKNRDWRLVMPWIPDEVERDGFARTWEQVPRPGRDPLAYTTGGALRTFTFTVDLHSPDADLPVGGLIEQLGQAADDGKVVTAMLGSRLLGLCVISGLSVRETEWDTSGEPVVASASIELTEAADAPRTVGPVPAIRGKGRNMARRPRGSAR